MILKLSSPSPAETFEIGKGIGRSLKGEEIILLCGGLGAGKTLMTKGIAASLGIDPDDVVSPTFTLMNQYQFRKNSLEENSNPTDSWFIHFDCYRFSDTVVDNQVKSKRLLSVNKGRKVQLGGIILPEIDEWIDAAVVVIEWAQFLHSSYFALLKSISVNFHIISPHDRSIKIKSKLDYLQL